MLNKSVSLGWISEAHPPRLGRRVRFAYSSYSLALAQAISMRRVYSSGQRESGYWATEPIRATCLLGAPWGGIAHSDCGNRRSAERERVELLN